MDLRSVSPWVWVAVAVLGIVLLVVAILIWRRRSHEDKAPMPSREPSLDRIYRDFSNSLPASARSDPAVIVLGERLVGKTSFVEAILSPAGRASLVATGAASDPRVQLWSGEHRIVQEISGEILSNGRPETQSALRALWAPIALRAPVVVVVIDAAGPSFTPAGLRDLGTLARRKIDILTELRGRPVRVRVCLTHVDVVASGFVPLATLIEEAGGAGSLRGMRLDPKTFPRAFGDYLPLGLRKCSAEELEAMADFTGKRGSALSASLEPFVKALFEGRGAQPAPLLDGLLLAALPDRLPAVLAGDALALDEREAKDEAQALTRRRRTRALAAYATAAALLLLPYLHHWFFRLAPAQRSVAALEAAADRPGAWTSSSRSDVDAAEVKAAGELGALLDPFWPWLHYAYPDRKAEVRKRYLDEVRRTYLFPVARRPDRPTRVYATALLYARREGPDGNPDPIGARILGEADAWAAKLGIPVSVVRNFVTMNEAPFIGLPSDIAPLARAEDATLEDWLAYLDRLEAATDAQKLGRAELEGLRREAGEFSAALDDATEAQSLAGITELLKKTRGLDVEVLFGPEVGSRALPAWVVDQRVPLTATLDIVRKANAEAPRASGKSLREALVDIEALTPQNPPTTKYTFPPPDPSERTRTFDAGAWTSVLAATRASAYVAALTHEGRTTQRLAFFAPNAYYPNAGASSSTGRGATTTVPGVYTKSAFDADVEPVLEGLDGRLAKMPLAKDDRVTLSAYVDEQTRRYAGEYRDALRAYYASFRFAPATVAALRADVTDMLAPSSWFSDFLATVARSAGVGPLDDPHERPVAEAVAEFQSIVAIMAEDKGKYPNLEKYTAILAPLLPSLDLGPPSAPPPRGTPLSERLTPISTLGFTLVTSNKPSALSEVGAYLDGASVPSALRKPFLAPVNFAYRFGLSDLEGTVARAYRDDVLPEVSPLLDQFPFNPASSKDAHAADVEAALGTKGTFWKAFEQDVAPVCQPSAAGDYTPRSTPLGPVKVPAGALALARWANKLGKVLWDKDGKPQPITISAKPLPLPSMGSEETVTLSYVRAGSASVYGFNQTPAFQAVPVPWAVPEASSVGIEVTPTGGGDKRHATVDADASEWSFWRLLRKAAAPEQGRQAWTWHIHPGGWKKPYAISFTLGADPFAPFRPPSEAR